MYHLSAEQKYASFQLLVAHGWQFDADRHDPRPGWRGWWLHPDHPIKCRRVGDAMPAYEAAEVTLNYYTDLTPADLPTLCVYRNLWVWPDGHTS